MNDMAKEVDVAPCLWSRLEKVQIRILESAAVNIREIAVDILGLLVLAILAIAQNVLCEIRAQNLEGPARSGATLGMPEELVALQPQFHLQHR